MQTRVADAEEKLPAYEAELERIRTRIDLEPGNLMQNLNSLPKSSSRMDSDKPLFGRGGRRGDSSGGHNT